ncbi:2-dehydropantoate 2-reductase [Clostridium sp. cel8]|uniref:2-dehydropantoate 2-reductase n=1 Tax=Clostridium sp. cel8 TaxID=2663123 RepID=UPI0015F534D7|nr:2-dehydropantoate 2-reductase [Clostridium sp. cel8]MBA5850876.1 2-dehydropantoate 2-reductase [Clostridium sp. cel8]
MKIAIAGSGALGCGFGYMMKKNGNDVTLIDFWEEHITTIKKNGLTITVNKKEDTIAIPIGKPDEIKGKFDVVFIFTKSMGLRHMLEEIKHLLTEDTKVICLLNGLGHANTIAEYVPRKNIIMGTTLWTGSIDAPGKTHFMGKGPVEVQNVDINEKESTLKIVNMMTDSGLNCIYSQNVHFTIWRKACANGTMNALCSLLDCNIKELFKTPEVEDLIKEIVREFSLVAETEGVHLDVEEIVNYLKATAEKIGEHYPSMHQDLKNKRLTEIDFLNGKVAKEAENKGLEAPYSKLITQLIHAKENILGIKS